VSERAVGEPVDDGHIVVASVVDVRYGVTDSTMPIRRTGSQNDLRWDGGATVYY